MGADSLFREHVLNRAGALFLKILTSANPKDDVFDCFVDSGTKYFGLISQRQTAAKPLVAAHT